MEKFNEKYQQRIKVWNPTPIDSTWEIIQNKLDEKQNAKTAYNTIDKKNKLFYITGFSIAALLLFVSFFGYVIYKDTLNGIETNKSSKSKDHLYKQTAQNQSFVKDSPLKFKHDKKQLLSTSFSKETTFTKTDKRNLIVKSINNLWSLNSLTHNYNGIENPNEFINEPDTSVQEMTMNPLIPINTDTQKSITENRSLITEDADNLETDSDDVGYNILPLDYDSELPLVSESQYLFAYHDPINSRSDLHKTNRHIGYQLGYNSIWILNAQTFNGFNKNKLEQTNFTFGDEHILFVNFSKPGKIAFRAEVGLAKYGRDISDFYNGELVNTTDVLKYIEFNLLAKKSYSLIKQKSIKTHLIAGLGFGSLKNSNRKVKSTLTNFSEAIVTDYNQHNLSLVIGTQIDIKISKKIYAPLSLRYKHGLVNIGSGKSTIPAHLLKTKTSALGVFAGLGYKL